MKLAQQPRISDTVFICESEISQNNFIRHIDRKEGAELLTKEKCWVSGVLLKHGGKLHNLHKVANFIYAIH